MRIARYAVDDQIRYGTVELAADVTLANAASPFPDGVADLTGDPMAGPVKWTGRRHPLDEVRLLAPVLPRSKVIVVTGNYVDDEATAGDLAPEVFLKPNTSVIGPDEPIVVPGASQDTVLEGHLAVVIGRICRHVPEARAPEAIFGYAVAGDVTAWDCQTSGPALAKSFDSFTPLGPWIITHLSPAEAGRLALTTRLDEKVIQEGTTRRLHWSIARQVAHLSDVMTLLPGDLILTGTPAGGRRLAAGQVTSVEIGQIGRLTNPVWAEEA